MARTLPQLKQAIEDISIAALSSWLKSQELPHTAGSREAIAQRIFTLLRTGRLSEEQFNDGLLSIEEASAKRIWLLRISEEHLSQLRDTASIRERMRGGTPDNRVLSPRLPSEAKRVYVAVESDVIRAKWAETHTKIMTDLVKGKITKTKTTKSIVLVANRQTGFVQLRFDKPELMHSHVNDEGKPDNERYVSFYLARATELLGAGLTPFEIHNALKSLAETEPRVVRIESKDIRTAANSRFRMSAKTDIRDDDDWKAVHAEGGATWSYENEMVYWIPGASGGHLRREVFTEIDGRRGRLRMDADCHEDEIEHVISQIVAHQRRAPQPQ